jgi:phospholipid/cholesterol/gamma-HCH transport system substrate-binding protein
LLETGKDMEPLKQNDEQPPRITMIPSLLEELGETGMATLKQARQMMISANAILDDENRTNLKATLVNLEAASGHMKPVLENLNTTLVQVKKLLDDRNIRNLSQAAGEVQPLLADTRVLIGKMQVATDKLDVAIGDASAGGTAALMPRLNELATDFSLTSRQLSRVLRVLEDSPQGLVFGAPALAPGPGEAGFNPGGEK